MKNLILTSLLTIGLLTACSVIEESKNIVNEQEIKPFLSSEQWVQKSGLDQAKEEVEFWQEKLDKNETPVYRMKLASAYQALFGITRDVEYLAKADAQLMKSNEFYKGENAEVLQALAQLSITKHDFQTAIDYAEQALVVKKDDLFSKMIIFDASMETGDYEHARHILENEITNKASFNFLIRNTQFQDHIGDSEASLNALRAAQDRVDYSKSLVAWTSSNLGDRLGHNGEVKASYDMFKYALNQESSKASYLHSLKGIAYIAYAHDGNVSFAKEILSFIEQNVSAPDVKLLQAEIAEYEGNDALKTSYLKAFYEEASKEKYYRMYDVELIKLAATEFGDYTFAASLLEKEISNRPNPTTYSTQAWILHHQGETEKARKIIEEKVIGKTFEPEPTYIAGIVLASNGDNEKGTQLMNEALESEFELGPVTAKMIRSHIQ